jgi:hypothetical protein
MMSELRKRFPLHFIVFKQTVCHLSYDANVEQVFPEQEISLTPTLTPSTLLMVEINKKSYKQSTDNVKDKYHELFNGH